MTTLWIFFTILQVVSLGFGLLALARLYHYIRRYRFDESKYTLLFGFIHLRWIATIYVVLVLLWVSVSYFSFIRI